MRIDTQGSKLLHCKTPLAQTPEFQACSGLHCELRVHAIVLPTIGVRVVRQAEGHMLKETIATEHTRAPQPFVLCRQPVTSTRN